MLQIGRNAQALHYIYKMSTIKTFISFMNIEHGEIGLQIGLNNNTILNLLL